MPTARNQLKLMKNKHAEGTAVTAAVVAICAGIVAISGCGMGGLSRFLNIDFGIGLFVVLLVAFPAQQALCKLRFAGEKDDGKQHEFSWDRNAPASFRSRRVQLVEKHSLFHRFRWQRQIACVRVRVLSCAALLPRDEYVLNKLRNIQKVFNQEWFLQISMPM